jgi:hypothetical protein
MAEINAVVLVEGVSDRVALITLARRLGRDLEAEGVAIVAMGGASALGEYLEDLSPAQSSDVKLAGLCDEAEVGDFQRGLASARWGTNLSPSDMEDLGIHVCVADLEDELIRAVGSAGVERIIEEVGELQSYRTFQNQPAWRGHTADVQLRRFMGTKSGRKVRYAELLVEALDLARAPRPLERVLAYVRPDP